LWRHYKPEFDSKLGFRYFVNSWFQAEARKQERAIMKGNGAENYFLEWAYKCFSNKSENLIYNFNRTQVNNMERSINRIQKNIPDASKYVLPNRR